MVNDLIYDGFMYTAGGLLAMGCVVAVWLIFGWVMDTTYQWRSNWDAYREYAADERTPPIWKNTPKDRNEWRNENSERYLNRLPFPLRWYAGRKYPVFQESEWVLIQNDNDTTHNVLSVSSDQTNRREQ